MEKKYKSKQDRQAKTEKKQDNEEEDTLMGYEINMEEDQMREG